MKVKSLSILLVFIAIMSCFIFSSDVIRNSINIVGSFYDYMFPSMIPLLISIYMLIDSGLLYYLAYLLQYITIPLFRLNGYGALCIIISFLTGFPFSTIILCKFYKEQKITKNELYVILCSLTLPSFSFIFTSIKNNLSHHDFINLVTYLYILSIVFTFTLSRILLKKTKKAPYKDFHNESTKQFVTFSFSSSLSKNIETITNSLAIILGTMVYFNIITTFLYNTLHIKHIISGLIEFSYPSIIAAKKGDVFGLTLILSFTSLSCLFQCSSILDDHKINTLPLFISKVAISSITLLLFSLTKLI